MSPTVQWNVLGIHGIVAMVFVYFFTLILCGGFFRRNEYETVGKINQTEVASVSDHTTFICYCITQRLIK